MSIKILRDSGRRMAWTDKRDGFLDLQLSGDIKESGYFRGSKKYLTGFSCSGYYWNQAKSVEVFPYGFRAFFEKEVIDVSLLVYEQAFYINAVKNAGIVDAVPDVIKYIERKSDAAGDSSKVQERFRRPVWHFSQVDDIKVVSSDCGIAVASDFDFYYSVKGGDLQLHVSESSESLCETDEPFKKSGWYFVTEENEAQAVEKAVRLAKQKAILKHCKIIDEYLEKVSVSTGDEKFDQSVMWARFSAWSLVTQDHDSEYSGIWAGLPWFRDNWGRDTFISLCGTLLVSGCFEEAKNVLMGFAGFQDMDQNSPSYGRIPNRYRNHQDVIYNTADGTLWFIRALWEYVEYSGDFEIIQTLLNNVCAALDADIARCDEHGFLKHGPADTWMDARIENKEALSARDDRANDIQALWFTALRIGSLFMEYAGDVEKAAYYSEFAAKVKKSFNEYFWSKDFDALADCLPPGGYGEWCKDMKVRPNQLFAITAPSCLPNEEENILVDAEISSKIISNVDRELVNPFGLYSLGPDDPTFHAHHVRDSLYHKDAAYHNGTIWEWNSGAYISASGLTGGLVQDPKATAILQNESKMIMDWGCAGSLSENIHASPDEDGNPILSGTYYQAWSVAEYARNVVQDVCGIRPRLFENAVELCPALPAGLKTVSANVTFGKGWSLLVKLSKSSGGNVSAKVTWKLAKGEKSEEIKPLKINEIEVMPGKAVEFTISPAEISCSKNGTKSKNSSAYEKFGCPKKWITSGFNNHDLNPEWNGASHNKDYLFNLIFSGRMLSQNCAGPVTAALEWFYESEEFKKKYVVEEELGALYSKRKTTFRLWSPLARDVKLVLFEDGENSPVKSTVQMKRHEENGMCGVWECSVSGDQHGVYYMFQVYVNGLVSYSADPYARACGVNGKRSMVCDFSRTNPEGWEKLKAPVTASPSDAIVWEAHVADLTSSESWNGPEEIRRTFTAIAEPGTKCEGLSTGLDYIKELGVTHVQLLPVFDFRSVDEKRIKDPEYRKQSKFGLFNWGYDPQNYGCLEGSYSSDPYDGAVRIREFKALVKKLAENGIGVIMDVVFNHINDGVHHPFGLCVPGYYYRVEGYSGAGEDTASEHEMYRNYMIDMLCFWLKEYKLSGFRFDLMGLHDAETMNKAYEALSKIKPDVMIYGEGWNMYNAGKMEAASMCNATKMPKVGQFNDALRCGIKGPVFADDAPGFIHNGCRREAVKFGLTGAVFHEQIDFEKVEGTACPSPWGNNPWKSVNYAEIHDNITMFDKLQLVEPGRDEEYYKQLQKFGISLFMLSEGMPIMHAGMEFLRTKQVPEDILKNDQPLYDVGSTPDGKKSFFRNTYNICDRVNGIDWTRRVKYADVVDYVKGLIKLRKEHSVFRLKTDVMVQESLKFVENKAMNLPEEVLCWRISGKKCKDSWKDVILIANPTNLDVNIGIPLDGNWHSVSDGVTIEVKDEILPAGSKFTARPKGLTIIADF